MFFNRVSQIKKSFAVAVGLSFIAAFLSLPGHVLGQAGVDRDLLSEISKIKAIDNHAHPLKYVAEGDKPDDEFDALPLDAVEPFPLPVRLKLDNPEFIGAWRTIYGYTHNDMSEAHVRELLETKQRIMP